MAKRRDPAPIGQAADQAPAARKATTGPTHDEAERQRLVRERREADGRRRSHELWQASGVPDRHAAGVENRSKAWGAKRDELEAMLGTGFLVALIGGRGSGKTQMAVALIRDRVHARPPVVAQYVRAMDVFLTIREAYRSDGPSERDQINRFVRPGLLVIDEAHVRGETAWEDRMLTHLIDLRYGAGVDTLLVSNETHAEFKASIGPSIYSRLIETGGVIECNWESFRRPR